MKWEELGPEERYKVVEMALAGKVAYRALCESFGMSRQTLDRAIATVRQAAAAALAPKGPGRKPVSEAEVKAKVLHEEKNRAEQERDEWKTKCEVMKTLLDLYRQYDVEIAPAQAKKKESKLVRAKKRGSGSGWSGTSSKKDGDTP